MNLEAAAHLTLLALPAMRAARFGRIVMVASRAAFRAETDAASYAVSKAGMVSLARCLARNEGPRGITANSICPGWVDTAMARPDVAARKAEIEAEIPLGRIATPEDCARAILFSLPARPLRERDGPRPQRRLVPPLTSGLALGNPAVEPGSADSPGRRRIRPVTRCRGPFVVFLPLAGAGTASAKPGSSCPPTPPAFRLFLAPPALAGLGTARRSRRKRRRRASSGCPATPTRSSRSGAGPLRRAARPPRRRGERGDPEGPRARPEDRVERQGPRREATGSRSTPQVVPTSCASAPASSGSGIPETRSVDALPAARYAAGFAAPGAGAGAGGFGGGGGIRLIAALRARVIGRSERPEGSNCPAFFAGLAP